MKIPTRFQLAWLKTITLSGTQSMWILYPCIGCPQNTVKHIIEFFRFGGHKVYYDCLISIGQGCAWINNYKTLQ